MLSKKALILLNRVLEKNASLGKRRMKKANEGVLLLGASHLLFGAFGADLKVPTKNAETNEWEYQSIDALEGNTKEIVDEVLNQDLQLVQEAKEEVQEKVLVYKGPTFEAFKNYATNIVTSIPEADKIVASLEQKESQFYQNWNKKVRNFSFYTGMEKDEILEIVKNPKANREKCLIDVATLSALYGKKYDRKDFAKSFFIPKSSFAGHLYSLVPNNPLVGPDGNIVFDVTGRMVSDGPAQAREEKFVSKGTKSFRSVEALTHINFNDINNTSFDDVLRYFYKQTEAGKKEIQTRFKSRKNIIDASEEAKKAKIENLKSDLLISSSGVDVFSKIQAMSKLKKLGDVEKLKKEVEKEFKKNLSKKIYSFNGVSLKYSDLEVLSSNNDSEAKTQLISQIEMANEENMAKSSELAAQKEIDSLSSMIETFSNISYQKDIDKVKEKIKTRLETDAEIQYGLVQRTTSLSKEEWLVEEIKKAIARDPDIAYYINLEISKKVEVIENLYKSKYVNFILGGVESYDLDEIVNGFKSNIDLKIVLSPELNIQALLSDNEWMSKQYLVKQDHLQAKEWAINQIELERDKLTRDKEFAVQDAKESYIEKSLSRYGLNLDEESNALYIDLEKAIQTPTVTRNINVRKELERKISKITNAIATFKKNKDRFGNEKNMGFISMTSGNLKRIGQYNEGILELSYLRQSDVAPLLLEAQKKYDNAEKITAEELKLLNDKQELADLEERLDDLLDEIVNPDKYAPLSSIKSDFAAISSVIGHYDFIQKLDKDNLKVIVLRYASYLLAKENLYDYDDENIDGKQVLEELRASTRKWKNYGILFTTGLITNNEGKELIPKTTSFMVSYLAKLKKQLLPYVMRLTEVYISDNPETSYDAYIKEVKETLGVSSPINKKASVTSDGLNRLTRFYLKIQKDLDDAGITGKTPILSNEIKEKLDSVDEDLKEKELELAKAKQLGQPKKQRQYANEVKTLKGKRDKLIKSLKSANIGVDFLTDSVTGPRTQTGTISTISPWAEVGFNISQKLSICGDYDEFVKETISGMARVLFNIRSTGWVFYFKSKDAHVNESVLHEVALGEILSNKNNYSEMLKTKLSSINIVDNLSSIKLQQDKTIVSPFDQVKDDPRLSQIKDILTNNNDISKVKNEITSLLTLVGEDGTPSMMDLMDLDGRKAVDMTSKIISSIVKNNYDPKEISSIVKDSASILYTSEVSDSISISDNGEESSLDRFAEMVSSEYEIERIASMNTKRDLNKILNRLKEEPAFSLELIHLFGIDVLKNIKPDSFRKAAERFEDFRYDKELGKFVSNKELDFEPYDRALIEIEKLDLPIEEKEKRKQKLVNKFDLEQGLSIDVGTIVHPTKEHEVASILVAYFVSGGRIPLDKVSLSSMHINFYDTVEKKREEILGSGKMLGVIKKAITTEADSFTINLINELLMKLAPKGYHLSDADFNTLIKEKKASTIFEKFKSIVNKPTFKPLSLIHLTKDVLNLIGVDHYLDLSRTYFNSDGVVKDIVSTKAKELAIKTSKEELGLELKALDLPVTISQVEELFDVMNEFDTTDKAIGEVVNTLIGKTYILLLVCDLCTDNKKSKPVLIRNLKSFANSTPSFYTLFKKEGTPDISKISDIGEIYFKGLGKIERYLDTHAQIAEDVKRTFRETPTKFNTAADPGVQQVTTEEKAKTQTNFFKKLVAEFLDSNKEEANSVLNSYEIGKNNSEKMINILNSVLENTRFGNLDKLVLNKIELKEKGNEIAIDDLIDESNKKITAKGKKYISEIESSFGDIFEKINIPSSSELLGKVFSILDALKKLIEPIDKKIAKINEDIKKKEKLKAIILGKKNYLSKKKTTQSIEDIISGILNTFNNEGAKKLGYEIEVKENPVITFNPNLKAFNPKSEGFDPISLIDRQLSLLTEGTIGEVLIPNTTPLYETSLIYVLDKDTSKVSRFKKEITYLNSLIIGAEEGEKDLSLLEKEAIINSMKETNEKIVTTINSYLSECNSSYNNLQEEMKEEEERFLKNFPEKKERPDIETLDIEIKNFPDQKEIPDIETLDIEIKKLKEKKIFSLKAKEEKNTLEKYYPKLKLEVEKLGEEIRYDTTITKEELRLKMSEFTSKKQLLDLLSDPKYQAVSYDYLMESFEIKYALIHFHNSNASVASELSTRLEKIEDKEIRDFVLKFLNSVYPELKSTQTI